MDFSEKKQLSLMANKVRQHIIEGTFHAKSGHPGGSLSAADVITYLYGKELKVDPKNPDWPDRDRFVLSKGHAAPALYGALAEKGFFPADEIKNLRTHLRSDDSRHIKVQPVEMRHSSRGQPFGQDLQVPFHAYRGNVDAGEQDATLARAVQIPPVALRGAGLDDDRHTSGAASNSWRKRMSFSK